MNMPFTLEHGILGLVVRSSTTEVEHNAVHEHMASTCISLLACEVSWCIGEGTMTKCCAEKSKMIFNVDDAKPHGPA